MELTVYRQSSKQRPDGTIVYKGEDARPYVDDNIFFVADGLGGAAAIRHQQINPDMFDKDKLMDTLFKGVYEDYSDERFVKYVTDSFFELFAVKECYTENINNIKKSGYFASRIVTAIVLHEMIYDQKRLNPKKLFDYYNSCESQEAREAFLKKLGDYFAEKIKDDIRKIAKNANLIYESSYTGLALLGSTLCATIYYETEDCVETLYLTAGDSRPYVWTETEGLRQIIEDEEGKDGGMTNYIKANDDATFGIRCNYYKFSKPCILFNASDGCFDSGYFLSQMAFEKLILEKGLESEDTQKMGESIQETFLTYGKHDDSSTIAMKFFGFDSFKAFQDSASRRLEELNSEYLTKMSDLLDRDYISEYEETASKLPARLSGLKTKFEGETAVRDFCVEQIQNGKYPTYTLKLKEVDDRITEAKQQKIRLAKCVEDIVARNYFRFLPLQKHKESWGEKRAVSKINSIDDRHKKQSEDFVSLLESYKKDFEDSTERLRFVIGRIFEIGVPTDYSDYDDICINVVEKCEQSMDSLFEFFYSVKKKKQGAISKLTQLRSEYIAQNLKHASGNEENLHRIRDMVISGEIDLEIAHTRILQDDFEELKQELAKIKDIDQLIESLEKDEKKKVFQECRDLYWNEKYVSIIEAIVDDSSVAISDGLRNEAKAIIEEMKSQTDEIKNKSELQSSLFAKYDEVYGQLMGGIAK